MTILPEIVTLFIVMWSKQVVNTIFILRVFLRLKAETRFKILISAFNLNLI
jgi:hypothetical protein